MKKFTSLSLAVLGCLLCAMNIQLRAQTVDSISYHYEYVQPTCTVPATGYFYYIAETNNYATTDSIDFFIDFGDGNDTTIRRAQNFYNGLQASTPIASSDIQHIYQAQGIYHVIYISTLPDGNADTLQLDMMVTSVCNNVTGRLYVDMNNDCQYNAGDVALSSYYVHLDYNGFTKSSVNTNAQGLFTLSACPGYTYSLAAGNQSYPDLVLTCSTSQGMPVTPSPNANQDLVVSNVNTIRITQAADSTNFSSIGNCIPHQNNFYLRGASFGYIWPNDSVDAYINFGDGQDTTISTAVYSSGLIGDFNIGVQHTYTAQGSYNVMYVATGPDGLSDTIIHYNQINLVDTCGTVTGDVYIDNNNNCIFDSGDSAMVGVWVQLYSMSSSNLYYAFTDGNGHYSFTAPAGNYIVSLSTAMLSYFNIVATCPASALAMVTVVAANNSSADFALTCPSGHDLTTYMHFSGGIYPTTSCPMEIFAANYSCNQIPGSVTLILDPLVHYVSACANFQPTTVNGDTITWTFNNVNSYAYWYSYYSQLGCLTVIGDASLVPGDSVCFTLIINPISGDINPANNTIVRCVPAFVSLDPNEKQVTPKGNGPLGYVPQGTSFDYTINFQNTGTAPAKDIFILDTLDADLDLSTLIITGSSHYMEPTFLPGNVVRFSYPNIYLADSTSDEPQSHGWVTYRVAAKPFLLHDTPIENTAGIYFDFNPVVLTNSTLNTIYDPSSVEEIAAGDVNVFPNPASSSVEIKFSKESNGVYTLTDLAGKEVFKGTLQGLSTTIDVSKLQQGVYLLHLETEQGRSVHKILVQR